MQPFLGPQMAELWPVIRFKFASALQAWHPSDSSAHVILAPWHKVGPWRQGRCALGLRPVLAGLLPPGH